MSESTSTTVETSAQRPARAYDWWSLTGLVFVVIYILLVVIDPGVDTSEKNAPAKAREWLDDIETSSLVLQGALAMLAIASLVVFVHRVDDRLAAAGVAEGRLRSTLRTAGWVAAVMFMIDGSFVLGAGITETASDDYQVSGDAMLALQGASAMTWAFAITAGGVVVLCAGLAARKTGAMPAWLMWASLVIGVLCALAVPLMAMPTPLLGLWLVVTSIAFTVWRPATA
ncbi:hypothetical protein [Yinghuangia soli]|uniref:DUF4386 family protein n=1 Tax=Yinghuangia soli TaxID=2908204 RepID=A0AA41PYP3_9ACTN|nr:hypothetical protein [Yinghuangia soli]MCF2527795.1 hypothetical protein [Yinghuangia soli]